MKVYMLAHVFAEFFECCVEFVNVCFEIVSVRKKKYTDMEPCEGKLLGIHGWEKQPDLPAMVWISGTDENGNVSHCKQQQRGWINRIFVSKR